jgi:ADP-dependent NAD(P)H-hydrate dehydratase / NAD(P)H-hydrate epimerase
MKTTNYMKIFNTSQVRALDAVTITNEPITSIDLMERAADAVFNAFIETFELNRPVFILAGPGNNGGDALALARKLLKINVEASVILLSNSKLSADCEANKIRLQHMFPAAITEQKTQFVAPVISKQTLIIDGLFGSGLTRPIEGIYADAVYWANNSGNEIISIDIPSGLQGEENTNFSTPIVKAKHTFSFQFPKLSFLLPESGSFVGDWQILNIGIHSEAISSIYTPYSFLMRNEVLAILKNRDKFSHKGTFGHLLLLAGCKDMAGAAVLSSKAALRSGAGLVTVHSAACNRIIVQCSAPEAIFHSDKNEEVISEFPILEKFDAVAVGSGIGQNPETVSSMKQLLLALNKPCVIDADALNIISENKSLLEKIPVHSILTPHPKEFERLFGKTENSYRRMLKASEMAVKYQFIIILKGAHTAIALPDGQVIFNSTGNAGMATAGSGDVLTGILGSLLAQGYSAENASKLGVYIHGLAADIALNTQSKESLIAGDIVAFLGKAFYQLRKI